MPTMSDGVEPGHQGSSGAHDSRPQTPDVDENDSLHDPAIPEDSTAGRQSPGMQVTDLQLDIFLQDDRQGPGRSGSIIAFASETGDSEQDSSPWPSFLQVDEATIRERLDIQLYGSIDSILSASYAGPSKPGGHPSDPPDLPVNELLEAGQQECASNSRTPCETRGNPQGSNTQSPDLHDDGSLGSDRPAPAPSVSTISASGKSQQGPCTAGSSLREDENPENNQQQAINNDPMLAGPEIVYEDAKLRTSDRQRDGAVGNEQEHSQPHKSAHSDLPSDDNSSSWETVSESSSDRRAPDPRVRPPEDRFWLAKQEAACLLIICVLFYSWYGHFESTLSSDQRAHFGVQGFLEVVHSLWVLGRSYAVFLLVVAGNLLTSWSAWSSDFWGALFMFCLSLIFDIFSFPWWAEPAGRLWRWCSALRNVCGTKSLVGAVSICVLKRFLIVWLDKPQYARCPSLCRAMRHLQGHMTTVVFNLTCLFLCRILLISTTPSSTTTTGIQEFGMTPFRALLYIVHTYTFLWSMTLPNAVALSVVTIAMVARWKFQVEDHPSALVMALILGVVNFYLSFIHVAHTPYPAYAFAFLVTFWYLISLLPDLAPFRGALRNISSIWAPNEKEISQRREKKCGITIRRTYSAPPLKRRTGPMKGPMETVSIVDDSDEKLWRLTVVEQVDDAQALKTEYLVQPVSFDFVKRSVQGSLIEVLTRSPLGFRWTVMENPTPSVGRLNTAFEFAPTCSIEQGFGGLANPLAALPQSTCAATMATAATMTTAAMITRAPVTGGLPGRG